jgi:creatinine amidohydrolase
MTIAIRKFLEMSWIDVQSAATKDPLVIIPAGQIVQHGPHLPVATDIWQAEGCSSRILDALALKGHEAILGPTVSFSFSPAQEGFPGYINLTPETLADQVEQISTCLARQGFRRQAVVLFGPGSWSSLNIAASRLARDKTAKLLILDGLNSARAAGGHLLEGVDTKNGKYDVHAGELETSLMLAVAPHLVNMDLAVSHYSELYASFFNHATMRGALQQQMGAIGFDDWRDFGADGVTGDATRATAAKGNAILDLAVNEIVRHFEHFVLNKD